MHLKPRAFQAFLQTSLIKRVRPSKIFCKKKYNITKGDAMKKKKMEESGINRRNFLKLSAALGAAATLTGIPAITGEAASKKVTIEPFKQGMVNTALGPISPAKLGTTLMHEHFVFGYPGWYADDTIAPYDYGELKKISGI